MKLKTIFTALLFFFIMILVPTFVFANDSQEVELEVTTDKQAYETDETILYEIKLLNTTDERTEHLMVETTLPDGLTTVTKDLQVVDNQVLWEIDSLDASEEKGFTFSLALADQKAEASTASNDEALIAPKTGDNTSFLSYIIILIISVIVLIVALYFLIKKKKADKALLLLIALSLLSAPYGMVQAKEKAEIGKETHEITIDGETYEIVTTVKSGSKQVIEEQVKTDESQGNVSENDLELTGHWFYDDKGEQLSWELLWNSENIDGTYNVYSSDTGNEDDFEVIKSDWEETSLSVYDFNTTDNTYFMIKTTDDEAIQSNIIVADPILDSDADELPDSLEAMYKTDANNPDTDGDSLLDGYEISVLGSDPLKADSDANGVPDGEEDYDSDGLTNLDEYQLGTDPLFNDTDFDGLLDDEEVNLYQTDPLNQDTDGDGMSDGLEIEYDTDPLTPDSNGDGILDGDERYTAVTEPNDGDKDSRVFPTITMDMKGKDLESLSISSIADNDPILHSEIAGYIGSAYNFQTDAEFATATMTFNYDSSVVTENFSPEIFYYNEEEQRLDRLENQIHDSENNTVSAQVEHFSSYMLLNTYEWDQLWEEEVIPPLIDEEGMLKHIDIVFTIDSSGSMSREDPEDIRKTASQAFVDKLREEDRAAVVDFATGAQLLIELTTDKNEVKYAIDMIDSSGGTNLNRGLTEAIDEIAKNGNEDHLKYVIFLTDGQGSWRDSTLEYAKEHGVVVYTIGLGDGVEAELLQRIAEGTGGKYFPAENADQLEEIFEETAGDSIDRLKDTDEDGIPDYLEKTGIRLGNGTYIEGLDYENKDTDGDGLLDGEEVSIYFKENEEGKVYFTLHSNPIISDSDGDGILDALDPEQLEYNITDRSLALAAGLSYNNLSNYVNQDLSVAMADGYKFKNMETEDLDLLKDWTVVQANDSGVGYWKDFWDSGLGSVAIKYTKSTGDEIVIFGLRGTEGFGDDLLNDGAADIRLGLTTSSFQSNNAFREYTELINENGNANIYLAGHSLGGRLVQDVNYKVYNSNEGETNYLTPTHSSTFNALGFNRIAFLALRNSIVNNLEPKINNYYYTNDLVGQDFGNSLGFKRLGTDIGFATARDKTGNVINDSETVITEVHGVSLFHYDSNLVYPNTNIIE